MGDWVHYKHAGGWEIGFVPLDKVSQESLSQGSQHFVSSCGHLLQMSGVLTQFRSGCSGCSYKECGKNQFLAQLALSFIMLIKHKLYLLSTCKVNIIYNMQAFNNF